MYYTMSVSVILLYNFYETQVKTFLIQHEQDLQRDIKYCLISTFFGGMTQLRVELR